MKTTITPMRRSNNMKKQYIIISLALIAIVGSFFTAFASNLLFGDIINIQSGFAHSTFFVTLPAIAVALSCVLAVLYIIRVYKHKDCIKRLSRLYAILLAAFNIIGLIGIVLAAAITYHTYFSNNPFNGYLMIFTFLNVLLLAGAIFVLVFIRKLQEDANKIKINALYVLKTVGWVLFILLAFNRFGTFLAAPTFVYLRNLYMTFPFYLWLLTPMYLGVVEVLYILEVVDKKKLFLFGIIGAGVNVALFAYTAIIGIQDTAFIASLSQTMPVERMTSKPLEMLIHLLAYLGMAAVMIVQAKKKEKE